MLLTLDIARTRNAYPNKSEKEEITAGKRNFQEQLNARREEEFYLD